MRKKQGINEGDRSLRLLIAEDNPRDAKLAVATLEHAGYRVAFERVDSPDSFRERLSQGGHEVVVSDYNLPGWNAADTLQIVKESGIDIPCIVVSGSLGDEAAVDLIKQGAADYVLKDRMARLPSAIERALEEKALRAERLKVESALRLSESMFRDLLESAPDGIVAVNQDGLMVLVNAQTEKLFGYPRQELLGRPLESLVPESLRPTHTGHPEAGSADPQVRSMGTNIELSGLHKDGRQIPVEISLSPLQTNEGTLVLSVIRDITERTQLQQQLFQAQKMEAVGRLAGGIAHDFNNHLGIIMGYSELMLDRLGPDDPLRKNATMIQEASHRAAALTRQLLAFSRRQVLEPKIVDLNEIVSDIGKMLKPLIGEDIDLVTSLSSELGKVKVDPTQVDQIIMNLAVNARNAMPKGGKLTIATSNVELGEEYTCDHAAVRPGPYVMVAVTDTGTGMDKETQTRIFEPFFTTKERGKGTGLGLATVYGIVKQSGGFIWVYSEPGLGTTFKVYLPRVEPVIREAAAGKAVPRAWKGSETVLVVEDEEWLRKVACEFLTGSGYTVLEAGSGIEAIETSEWHQGAIHLLMTDAIMPGMNGRAVADRLLGDRPEMKVLCVSGYTDDTVLRNGLLEEGLAFLQKPFTREALVRKVRDVLEGKNGKT